MERAIEINPANPWNQADFGNLLCSIGRAEEGLERLRSARRADPYFGPSWYWSSLGRAQFVLRRYADALADFDRGTTPANDLAMMAGCCARLALQSRSGIGDAMLDHSAGRDSLQPRCEQFKGCGNQRAPR